MSIIPPTSIVGPPAAPGAPGTDPNVPTPTVPTVTPIAPVGPQCDNPLCPNQTQQVLQQRIIDGPRATPLPPLFTIKVPTFGTVLGVEQLALRTVMLCGTCLDSLNPVSFARPVSPIPGVVTP